MGAGLLPSSMRWIAALGLVVLFTSPAEPCATAPPRGEEAQIADEEAVIIWDADRHVEHFIRKASFHATAASFGFLVPTPTTPELGEVSDGAFGQLLWAVAPKQRIESRGFEPGCLLMMGDQRAGSESAVHVIQTAHVAGFDATTLEASDPAALAGWLGHHGFDTTPALTDWLDRYVATHWKVTAFVVAGEPNSEIATRSVRMTFSTDRPFYPYREPVSPQPTASSRLLRVFVLASQRYAATLADKPWVATPFYAAPITVPSELVRFTGEHPIVATVFSDTSSPRRGIDEVYFAPSADQSALYQPEVVSYQRREVPLELVVIGVIAVCVVAWVLRRRRRGRVIAE